LSLGEYKGKRRNKPLIRLDGETGGGGGTKKIPSPGKRTKKKEFSGNFIKGRGGPPETLERTTPGVG